MSEEPSELELRAERLREESQRAHSALARYQDPLFLVRVLIARARRVVAGAARRIVSRESRFATSPAADRSDPRFHPYPVRTPVCDGGAPRVLHAIANVATGGSARLVVDLIERLGDRYDQQVLARDIRSGVGYEGWRLHHLPEARHPGVIATLLRRLEIDLLHVHFLGHHRSTYSERDWIWYDAVFRATEESSCAVIENVNIPVEPYLHPRVQAYVFVSDVVRRQFGVRGAHQQTIHPGSDLDLFRRRAEAPDDVIGMVYRLERDKLDTRSLDPILQVLRRRSSTRALIVGGGTLLPQYRQRVADLGLTDRVEFPGYVPYEELPHHYNRMSVFVAPVHTESFGQVVPFAMGMELPVAGYDTGALSEILGARDCLAPPGDVHALAQILERLLDDRPWRARLGVANRRRAEERFSVDSMIADYAELYHRVLEENKG